MANINIEELLFETESSSLDFKSEPYKFANATAEEKSELLKDVIAFANSWRRDEAYILIGVKEIKGGSNLVIGIDETLDDAHIQQFINKKTQKPITFSYQLKHVAGKKVGVISIPVQQRPFYLLKDFGKLKKNVVYIRRGSSTEVATPDEIYQMGVVSEKETETIPAIKVEFAEIKNKTCLGTDLQLNTTLLDIPELNEVPDYDPPIYKPSTALEFAMFHSSMQKSPRKSYYRDLVEYYFFDNCTRKIEFTLTNDSRVTVNDVRVEIEIDKSESHFTISTYTPIPEMPVSHNDHLQSILNANLYNSMVNINSRPANEILVEELPTKFILTLKLKKIQPKQRVFMDDPLYISVTENIEHRARVKIYADNIPVPIEDTLTLSCHVDKKSGSLNEILKLHDYTCSE